MAKVVYGPIEPPESPPKKPTSKRVMDADGNVIDVRTVDADSPSFEVALSSAFRRNVKKARQENKGLVGQPKRVSAER